MGRGLRITLIAAVAALAAPAAAARAEMRVEGTVTGADGAPAAGHVTVRLAVPHTRSMDLPVLAEQDAGPDGRYSLVVPDTPTVAAEIDRDAAVNLLVTAVHDGYAVTRSVFPRPPDVVPSASVAPPNTRADAQPADLALRPGDA